MRPHIHTLCNCRSHPFPVPMRYGGRVRWYGRVAYLMYCPFSALQRLYIYTRSGRYRRVL